LIVTVPWSFYSCPSPWGLWLIHRHALAHLGFCPNASFLFLATLWRSHVPSQSSFFFEAPLQDELHFKFVIETPLWIEFSSILYIPPHFSPFRITLSSWLIVTTPFALRSGIPLSRALLWIWDCTVPPRHIGPPPEYASSHLYLSHWLTQCQWLRKPTHPLFWQTLPLLQQISWTSPSRNILELHYQNLIFSLYL